MKWLKSYDNCKIGILLIRTFMNNALQTCIRQANLPALWQMLQQSPELLVLQDRLGRTPIFAVPATLPDAVASQFLQVFAQAGASFAHQDVHGRTVAFEVCSRGLESCLAVVLAADQRALYRRDRLGQTPLFGAVRSHQLALIRRTALPGELINAQDEVFGHSILYYAAACGHDDLCMVLLKKGADLHLRDRCGQNVLSYAKKTLRFAVEARRQMMAAQHEAQASGMEGEAVDEAERKQAYEMRAVRGNQVVALSAGEKKELLARYQQLEEKERREAYFQDAEFDPFDNYPQNWRNLAVKIVHNCLKHKYGRWFEHTSRAALLLPERELRGVPADDLVGLALVLSKLEHHVYQNANDFMKDMEQIWVKCEQVNGPGSRITAYVHDLRNYYYDQLSDYNYLANYSY